MSDARSARFNPWRFGVVVATAITIGTWAVLVALDKRAAQRTPPEPEMVEVCVAAKDMPVGTYITPEEVAKLVTWVRVPKDSVPEGVVVEEVQLHDRRIARPWRKGETFKLQDLVRGPVTLPEGMVVVSFPIDASHDDDERRRLIWPGARADIIATVQRGDKPETALLIQDSLIVAVNTAGWTLSMVSFAVDRDTLELIILANKRECKLSAKIPNPAQPFDSQPVDAVRVRQFLESLPEKPPSRP